MALEVTNEYPCTACASDKAQIIRPGENPRVKCQVCGFTYNGNDSLAAKASGAILPSSPESLAEATEPEVERRVEWQLSATTRLVPKNPAYVFVDKKSSQVEFCTRRDFKKTAINWSQSEFSVYELKPIKLNVKVDVSNRSRRIST